MLSNPSKVSRSLCVKVNAEPALPAAVNYHHWGDAKRWYGIPSAAAKAFETAFKKALPEKFEIQPDLLFHLTAMLSPRVLRQHDVPAFGVLQVCSPVATRCLLFGTWI